MKLGIMQPYFLPYIGYFQLINVVDKYILYDNINYMKKSWVNRNRFLKINNGPSFFNIPLKDKSSFKKINEIELLDNDIWRKQILNSIFFNYKRAKYFSAVYPLIETIVLHSTNKLSDLNSNCIVSICKYLGINTEIIIDSSKYNYIEEKLSSTVLNNLNFPEIELLYLEKKVVRILEICKIERASTYVNAIGGKSLYSKDDFTQNGIELKFIESKPIKYKQFDNNFVSDLSIIDVLMFNSVEEINVLLNSFTLI